jgi:hypothetical protein
MSGPTVLKVGNVYFLVPKAIILERRPYFGLSITSHLSAPVFKPSGIAATLYPVQLSLFWAMSDGAPHISYQDAWLYNGPQDPMD